MPLANRNILDKFCEVSCITLECVVNKGRLVISGILVIYNVYALRVQVRRRFPMVAEVLAAAAAAAAAHAD